MEYTVLFKPLLLLGLSCFTVIQGQYYDAYQGLQQFYQPYQRPVDLYAPYNDINRYTGTHRQPNRQNNRRREDDDIYTRKPPLDDYDNDFPITTPKPSRKTTKSYSSHSNKNSNIRNYNTDSIYTPDYEATTKRNRINSNKRTKTTTAPNNNFYDNRRVTTENAFESIIFNDRGSDNFNRPVTENVFENQRPRELYNQNNFDSRGNPQNNRRTDSTVGYDNNFSRVPAKNRNPNTQNINNNNNPNNRFINNEYNNNNNRGHSNNFEQPTNHRNPDVYAISMQNRPTQNNKNNNFGSPSSGFINTDHNNNRGNDNINRGTSNNKGTVNNRGSGSSNNRGTTNNRGSSNNRGVLNTEYDGPSQDNNYNNNPLPNRPGFINTDDNNNRGNDNINRGTSNNKGTLNNRGSSNNRGTTNNRGSSNNRGVLNTDYDGLSQDNNYNNNPLPNRPVVKPIPVDVNQPPITNKPVTNNPYDSEFGGLSERSDDSPDILIGPNEEDMSEGQKRQFISMAEKMCDGYKSMHLKKIVALPLLPSPDPVQVNVSSCVPITAPLVIGGKVASINEFPHMALVGWKKISGSGYSWKCGGSLISNQYVLTAGHCTYQDKDYEVDSGPPHAVQLGSSYLNDPGALVVHISAVIRHPKYKQRRSYYDIAVIKLAKIVRFSDTVRPACLGVPPPVGKKVIATGWGRTEFGGDHSVELRSVSLPVWNIAECREIWGTSLKLPNGPSPDSHMCAGEKAGGKDTCQGDSGGPAQIQDGCVWRVVAVTSYGRSCGAPNTPALYAITQRVFVSAVIFGYDDDQALNQRPSFEDPKELSYNNRQTGFSNSRPASYPVNDYRIQ